MWTVINPCTSLYIFSTTDKNGEEVNLETLKVLFNIIFWQECHKLLEFTGSPNISIKLYQTITYTKTYSVKLVHGTMM